MVEPTQLPNAPITEALLDIQVKLPAGTDLAKLATFHEGLKQRYPSKQERVSWRGSIEIKAKPVAHLSQSAAGGPDGYLFTAVVNCGK